MKGFVFLEFFNLVKTVYGENMVDDIIEESSIPSGGSYTSAAVYDHNELLALVKSLSRETGAEVSDLVHTFGHYLFSRFSEIMPQFFIKPKNAFEFLQLVHDTVHVEVKKLYPDAILPEFITIVYDSHHMDLIYKSRCPLADFAEGLIAGCIDHYKEMISIDSQDMNRDGYFSRVFRLERHAV